MRTGTPTIVVVPDPARRLGGRGAWITPDLGLVDQAVTRRAFQRAFKLPGIVDASRLTRHLHEQGHQTGGDPTRPT